MTAPLADRFDFDPARRQELARRVADALQADPRVGRVEQIGSMATGRADRYSDIDLMVHLVGCTDRDFFFDIPELLRPVGPVLIEGWGFVAFPRGYIATFNFDGYPLFWQVDIACRSDQHVDASDLLRISRWEQLYKVWIHAAKLELRAREYAAVLRGYIGKRVDVSDVSPGASAELIELLERLGMASRARGAPYEEVHTACREVVDRLLR